jgi:glycosyltransferase involved in cell wall biosynthesis
MQATPVISMIMTVKNGLPYLGEALESVFAQDFADFELIVQDGQSDDGSLELLHDYEKIPELSGKIRIESRFDNSLAEAKQRAFKRCQGEIIGSIDADNLLLPGTFKLVSEYLKMHPNVAVLYGSQIVINEHGEELSRFDPLPFNIIDHLCCRNILPFGSSFFRSKIVGNRLLPNLNMRYCADYELWIKLSHLKMQVTHTPLTATRISDNSINCRPESYEDMCQEKIHCLQRYISSVVEHPLSESIIARCTSGIYLWAANSVARHFTKSKHGPYFERFLNLAFTADPLNPDIEKIIKRYKEEYHG